MIDAVNRPGDTAVAIRYAGAERGRGAIEAARQLPGPVDRQLARPVIVGIRAERGKRRKQIADALGNFRVAAGPEVLLQRRKKGGQLIEVSQLRVLPANRLLGEFISGAHLLEPSGNGSRIESRSQVLPRISRSGSVADIALNDPQGPLQAEQMICRRIQRIGDSRHVTPRPPSES